MKMRETSIYCVDVGSVHLGRFAWAHAETGSGAQQIQTSSNIDGLIDSLVKDLDLHRPVALGFECPLFIPIAAASSDLTRARPFEGNRAWSAAAGPSSLATGLVQSIWVLKKLKQMVRELPPPFFDPSSFAEADIGVLFWEAFVSGRAHTIAHEQDASLALTRFLKMFNDGQFRVTDMDGEVHSIIGSALLRADWTTRIEFLSMPCCVVIA